MDNPPLFNFQAILAEQGVTYDAGLHPPRSNIVDSPMQAYHEEMIDSDSESSSMIQFVKIDDSQFSEANAMMLAQFSLAKSFVKSIYLPKIHLENGFFLGRSIFVPSGR
jgi:hypothetical protein